MKYTKQPKDSRSPLVDAQFGVVPFVFDRNELKVVLITSRSNKKKWLFPKGHDEPHLSHKEVARTEAYEEAGLLGIVGAKRHAKSFSRLTGGRQRQLQFYPMEVTMLLRSWPEQAQRQRCIVSIPKALQLVQCRHLKQILLRMVNQLHTQEQAS
ncbi:MULTISPECIES: NUDIX hydrolase [Corallincola]|uniref:NUDIX hydrolase n=2 Tax=Corallincola TaxID=1775176 RepID=A0ABY1WS78_9GAMM|nr:MULTISPECIES: NUDIX hydrolase [Corallincola]TAA47592.1 NUDIX hydrolase [Corallincola spongiicola]TCI05274.1 NUDIX hydrolase [Corallincola luteus]